MPIYLGWKLAVNKRVKLVSYPLADFLFVEKQSSMHPQVDGSRCCLLRDCQFPDLGERQWSSLQHSTGHKVLPIRQEWHG